MNFNYAKKQIKIHIIYGSKSDIVFFDAAIALLKKKKITYEEFIISAHRNTKKLLDYCEKLKSKKDKKIIIITVAGLSAALPGIIAANTDLPVIHCPVINSPFKGLDSYISAVQTPSAAPVVSVGSHKKAPENLIAFIERIINLF